MEIKSLFSTSRTWFCPRDFNSHLLSWWSARVYVELSTTRSTLKGHVRKVNHVRSSLSSSFNSTPKEITFLFLIICHLNNLVTSYFVVPMNLRLESKSVFGNNNKPSVVFFCFSILLISNVTREYHSCACQNITVNLALFKHLNLCPELPSTQLPHNLATCFVWASSSAAHLQRWVLLEGEMIFRLQVEIGFLIVCSFLLLLFHFICSSH